MTIRIRQVLTSIFAAALMTAAPLSADGQITIKIPRINVPKTNSPKTSQPDQSKPSEAPKSETTAVEGGFRVGDEVEIYCDCFGRMAWTPGRIESISGGYYTVRYGSGRYQTKPIAFGNTSSIRDPKKYASEQAEAEYRRKFLNEAQPFWVTVYSLANVYDSNLQGGGYSDSPEFYAGAVKDLNALNEICRNYPNLTNPKNLIDSKNIAQRPADWCAMAAMGEELPKKAKSRIVMSNVDGYVKGQSGFLEKKLADTEGWINDSTQLLLFSRAEWEKGELEKIGKQFADMGQPVPAGFFDEIFKKADELKVKIERDAQTRSWTPPPFSRPAEEALAKARFVGFYKGASVVKIGSIYGDWKMYKNSVGIPTDRYIRGVALLKIPNRPLCQMQEWIVKQEYAGGGRWSATKMESFGGSGVFMKCQ